jgi:hypothetical protein
LRELVEDLGLPTAGLLEKADFVKAILSHSSGKKVEL